MGALALNYHWIPEDDLLLKNAIEAGASLESLAKGAVQFSRRFTVKELEDRWYSLLYDPVISAEASFRMIELERSSPSLQSKLNRTGNSKEPKGSSKKRNAKAVRSCYHELRKKMRSEPFDPLDLNFLVGSDNGFLEDPSLDPLEFEQSHLEIIRSAFPGILTDGGSAAQQRVEYGHQTGFSDHIMDTLLLQSENVTNEVPYMLDENLVLAGADELVSQESGDLNADPCQFGQVHGQSGNLCSDFNATHAFDSSIPECSPTLDNLESLSELPDTGLRESNIHERDLRKNKMANASEGDLLIAEPNLKEHMLSCRSKCPSASPDCYLADLSDSLFNEEEVSMVDGKEMADKSYYDGLNSLLLNSPNDAGQEHIDNTPAPETCVLPFHDKDDAGVCVGDLAKVQVFSEAPDKHPEIRDGIICCTLNTEDPEIPCNDDILILSRGHSSVPKWSFKEASNSVSTSDMDFPAKNLGKPPRSSMVKQAVQQTAQLNTVGRNNTGSGFSKSDSKNLSPGYPYISYSGHSTGTNTGLLITSQSKTGEIVAEKRAAGLEPSNNDPQMLFDENKQEQDVPIGVQDCHVPTLEGDTAEIADHELLESTAMLEPDEDMVESDDDVPCYSDIEAMILDMDLEPDEEDIFDPQVLRYQHEDIKRAIIRLEQSAHSYMQRAIASHGAFAVLYGRYSKYYLKKPKVLLGRTSDDIVVDIDLRQGGCSNTVSRRQAIIKLEKDGLILLKNIGRNPILVNDNEIGRGESSILNSNCLIEIRGLSFVFETNETCVKLYLDHIKEEDGSKDNSPEVQVS